MAFKQNGDKFCSVVPGRDSRAYSFHKHNKYQLYKGHNDANAVTWEINIIFLRPYTSGPLPLA